MFFHHEDTKAQRFFLFFASPRLSVFVPLWLIFFTSPDGPITRSPDSSSFCLRPKGGSDHLLRQSWQCVGQFAEFSAQGPCALPRPQVLRQLRGPFLQPTSTVTPGSKCPKPRNTSGKRRPRRAPQACISRSTGRAGSRNWGTWSGGRCATPCKKMLRMTTLPALLHRLSD